MTYTCIRIEGGLLSADFLERIAEMEGQKPQDFNLPPGRSLIDEISAIFSNAKLRWHAFLNRLKQAEHKGKKTSITREQWVIPLLEALGYKLTYQRRAEYIDGRSYPISHRAGEDETAPPVHIVSYEQELGEKPTLGRGRQISPHALLQEYLNRTEHLWGIVTNGHTLRILRDAFYFTRPSYIEFDLKQMLEGEHFDEFILFYRLVHRTRFPKSISDAKECLLECYHQESLAQGDRIREGLRNAVEKAIEILANGFLSHPKNNGLRQKLRENRLSPALFYQQLLRLIYRLLFLMVAEERHILTDNEIYHRYYSLSRLRDLSISPENVSPNYDDLYLGLRTLFQTLRDPKLSSYLDIKPLNGELFNRLDDLEDAYLKNKDLLKAIHSLSYFVPSEEKVLRRINYSALDVEELGSVYESLLDYQPTIPADFSFVLNPGTERKSTGSYYTPSCLVQELIKSALEPVIEKRLKNCSTKEEKERALLSLKICDPACGSGHFLLAAARRLGEELAKIRTEEEAPSPENFREAVRDIITNCLYGVDKNPLAVDLCKVALWIEGHCKGKPLTFLDHRIKCGDSLVGVFDLNVLKDGIPDEAYKPIEGDEREIARQLRRQNRDIQIPLPFFEFKFKKPLNSIAEEMRKLSSIPDNDPEKIHKKQVYYENIKRRLTRQFQAANLWTAAFFIEKTREKANLIPTTADIRLALRGSCIPQKIGYAEALSQKLRFFHWLLEFPEVFAQGGFDVVLGNPPWEKIKLQEKEFFAIRAPEIANALNRAERQRLIKKLKKENPALYKEFLKAKHDADATSLFLRASGRFPLTARGDINTYSVFAELALQLTGPEGRTGIIVPTGIATDDTNRHFFSYLMENDLLASLYDFENREKLFPAVDSRQKFSLLTLHSSPLSTNHSPQFVFFATRVEHLKDKYRRFSLTAEDIARINPNTRTTPIFRTRYDAELTKKIYRHVPVLVNEKTGENPWGVRFFTMFHMSNDSHIFRTRKDLEAEGYELKGNLFVKANGDIYLPLYEAKMIWQFDHRFGSYERVSSRSSTHLPTPTPDQYTDPFWVIKPWYWVSTKETLQRLESWEGLWLIGFRDVTNATNERTAIFSLLPKVGVNHKLPLIFVSENTIKFSCLFANLNSLVLDYVLRQKMGGTSLGFFILKQLPVLPPETYTTHHLLFAIPRVLELTYTAWDLKPFADDIWAEADEKLRFAIRKQWEENARETGGHKNATPPEWLEIIYSLNPDNPNRDACPLPPFKWDELRRARLRAELDAFFAKLYGLTEEELRYILDPEDIFGPDFPGETFRVLKEKEIKQLGEYRTKRLVLEAWRKLDSKGVNDLSWV